MPVLTAAPLPLLYGWRMTRAPAPVARSPVSSFEPSSTTRISCQSATERRSVISGPIEALSLKAGMTIDVAAVLETVAIVLGAADEPLDNPVPRDHVGPVVSRVAEGRRPPPVRGQTSEGRARSEEHTSELQSRQYLVCRLL